MGILRNVVASLIGRRDAGGREDERAADASRGDGAQARGPGPDDARALASQGRLVEALAACEAELASRGESADGRAMRGQVLRLQGRHVEAAREAARALSLDPRGLPARALDAACALELRRYDAAAGGFDALLAERPDDHDFAWGAIAARFGRGRWGEAEALLDRLARPGVADRDLALARGQCAMGLGKPEEAADRFRAATEADPASAAAWVHLAMACSALDRDENAREYLLRAIACQPASAGFSEAQANLAIAEFNLGRVELAGRMLAAGLPHGPVLHGLLQLGPTLLAQGRFRAGWRLFEHRWLLEPLASVRADLGIPQWNGQPLRGETVLVRAEQGMGDVFQFARYLPLLKARGATVHFQPLRDMERVAHRFRGVDHVVREGEPLADPAYFVNLMSMPLAFDTTLDTVPAEVPYLAPDPAFAARWATHFDGGRKPRVGLSWAGRPTHRRDRQRSLRLEQLAPILRVPGVRFVSLQKGPAADQAPPAIAGLDWEDVGPLSKELDDAVAILDRLDLLICVDTGLAHIAGALGKPAWVLLPDPADYRWLLGREDSPWYPTLRLFRQARPGAWAPVIDRVAGALDEWVRSGASPVARPARHDARAVDDDAPIAGMPFAAETRAGFIEFVPDRGDAGRSIDRYGEWRQDALETLAQLLRAGDTVLEVGAGPGIWSIPLARGLGADGLLLACESDPVLRVLLERNLATARIPNATVLRDAFAPGAQSRGEATTRRVDDLFLERLDAIVVTGDVDAASLLAGAEQSVWRCRPVIALDRALADAPGVGQRLRDFGYRGVLLERPLFRPSNFQRRQDDLFAGRRYGVVFALPEERPAAPFANCADWPA